MSSADEKLLRYIHRLVPFRDMDLGDRSRMARTAILVALKKPEEILARDASDKVLYLLRGVVELHHPVESPRIIHHQAEACYKPLFQEHEDAQSFIKVLSDTVLIEFDRKLLNHLIEKEVVVSEHLLSQEMGHVENSLYSEILQAVETGKLTLPSLPEVALNIRRAIEQPDVDMPAVSRIVEMDPALSARMIKVANSALIRGVREISSMRDVIVRLGLKGTRNLVIGFCVAQLFRTRHGLLRQKMLSFYEHSLEIASIAFALGNHIRELDADELLLAGLVHDIGVIPIIAYIDKTGLEFDSEADIDHLINALRVAAGVLVVKSWELPREMLNVVSHAEHWHRDNGETIQLADVIVIAQIYSMIEHNDMRRMPDLDRVPAFKKLDVGRHDPALAMSILDQARDEISEMQKLLHV